MPMPTLAACIMLTSFPPSPGREGGGEEGRRGRKGGEEGREERKGGRRGRRGRKGGEEGKEERKGGRRGRRGRKGGESHQSKEVEGLGKKGVKWEGSTYRRHRLVSWCVF